MVAAGSTQLGAYDANTGKLRQRFVYRPERIREIALSPDNKTLALVSGSSKRVALLDVRSGQDLLTLDVDSRELNSVAFSPLGDRLAVAGADEEGHGRIWEWTIDGPNGK